MDRKLALITGGSSGIGKAIALELAGLDYDLLLVSNQQKELLSCQQELQATHAIRCHVFYMDLSLPNAAQTLFAYCKEQGFVVDFLVNNAGILLFSHVHKATEGMIEKIMMLHMYTPTLLCRLFSQEMLMRKHGHILNVSSISSVMPYPCISLYGPTKTYMRFFSRAVRVELAQQGVKVCCLIPGATDTALYDADKVDLVLAKRLGIMSNAAFVAKKAVRDTLANKGESIPGWMNKLTMIMMPFVPNFLIRTMHDRTNLVQRLEKLIG